MEKLKVCTIQSNSKFYLICYYINIRGSDIMKIVPFDILKELSEKRPLFHNEKDFQFEFAFQNTQLALK